jgi:hypothetical protein
VERKIRRIGLASLILGQKDNDNFFMPSQKLFDTFASSWYDHPASSSFRITPYYSEQ